VELLFVFERRICRGENELGGGSVGVDDVKRLRLLVPLPQRGHVEGVRLQDLVHPVAPHFLRAGVLAQSAGKRIRVVALHGVLGQHEKHVGILRLPGPLFKQLASGGNLVIFVEKVMAERGGEIGPENDKILRVSDAPHFNGQLVPRNFIFILALTYGAGQRQCQCQRHKGQAHIKVTQCQQDAHAHRKKWRGDGCRFGRGNGALRGNMIHSEHEQQGCDKCDQRCDDSKLHRSNGADNGRQ